MAPDQGAFFRRDGVDAGQPDAGLLYPGNDVSQHRLDESRRLRLDIAPEVLGEDVGYAIAVEVRAGAGRMHGALARDLVDAVADVGLRHLDAGVLQRRCQPDLAGEVRLGFHQQALRAHLLEDDGHGLGGVGRLSHAEPVRLQVGQGAVEQLPVTDGLLADRREPREPRLQVTHAPDVLLLLIDDRTESGAHRLQPIGLLNRFFCALAQFPGHEATLARGQVGTGTFYFFLNNTSAYRLKDLKKK